MHFECAMFDKSIVIAIILYQTSYIRIMDFRDKLNKVQLSKSVVARFNKHYTKCVEYLKPKQYDCVMKAQQGNLVIMLPTGYGKSLIYHLLPFCNTNGVVLVIGPLTSIMVEQKELLGDLCCIVAEEHDVDKVRLSFQVLNTMYSNVLVKRPMLRLPLEGYVTVTW